MSPTKTWKLPLHQSWYSLKISCLSTKLLQTYLENWHEYSLRFRCLLFFAFLLINLIRYFHILVIKLEYLQVVTQEARKLFTGRQESSQGSNSVFDSLIFLSRQ